MVLSLPRSLTPSAFRPFERPRGAAPSLRWEDLREDKMINPAPGIWQIFGPLPTAGPGSPGNGPGSKIVQVTPLVCRGQIRYYVDDILTFLWLISGSSNLHGTIGPLNGPGAQHPLLGRTYGRILDFCFGGRIENGHEMVLESVSEADFMCVLHHLSSLTCLKWSWGQVWPENGPKPKLKFIF